MSISFEPSMSSFFFDECPASIIHNTTCLVCCFDFKVKRNLSGIWYNYMVSRTMRYFDVDVLTWVCYVWRVGIGNMFSFAFKGKLCPMFYYGI